MGSLIGQIVEPLYKLDPKVKAAWLEALRSGKYQQGKFTLKKTNADGSTCHCCLGVLCEVVGAREEDAGFGSSFTTSRFFGPHTNSTNVLPAGLVEGITPGGTLNVPIIIPSVKYGNGDPMVARNLFELNDDAGWSFDRIADVIEEQF